MNPIKWSPTPDPMMDELRAIRDEIGAEVQSMSIEQRLKHYQEKANEAAALIGKVFVPRPTVPFAQIMVSKESAY